MPLVLVDNNFVDSEELSTYLRRSAINRVAIPHTVFVEWHKGEAERVTRRVLANVCAHASQVVVLKDTSWLMGMSGRSAGLLNRLIDGRQTAFFPEYCRTFIHAPTSEAVSEQFRTHAGNAKGQVDALLPEGHKLMALFKQWDRAFDRAELGAMKGLLGAGRKLPDDLQAKTFLLAEEFALRSLRRAGLVDLARSRVELVNLLAFRYAATVVAFYVCWHDAPGAYPSSDKSVLNHLMDIKIAAQATYFDGFRTHETKLLKVYLVALGLVSALGGYTLCGGHRGLSVEQRRSFEAAALLSGRSGAT